MSDFDRDAFANAYGPIIFFGFFVFACFMLWLGAREDARATKAKIGPHVIGPDERLWRIAKETRLNGDVWFVAERWENGYWRAPYTGEFDTLEAAQAWLDAHFDYDRAHLTASREHASP